MGASAKLTSGAAMTRGPSSTALLIMGYRNEFTRGVLTASGSIIVVGILALLVSFGVSILF
jgi:threonine/homoserine/homoserine lactone efflux protein